MRGRSAILLTAAGAVVVCLLFFMLFIRPRQSDLKDVEEQITLAQDQQQQLQLELQQLQALRDDAPRLNAVLEEISGLVPKTHETANLIFQIQEAANRAGVDFLQITPELPKAPPEGATLAEVRLTIRSTGGYFALQDFIRRLYDLDRALRLDTLSLTLGEEVSGATAAQPAEASTTTTADVGATELQMEAAARVFFELPNGAAATAATVPTAPTTPAPAPTSPAPSPTS